jgi:glucuronokinase
LFSWFTMYNEKWKHFKPSRNQPPQSIRQIKKLQQSTPISSRVYARIGLLGNPSDGFNGKTLSLLIKNFSALVVLTPNENEEDESVKFQANNILDPIHYPGISSLSQVVSKDGCNFVFYYI